MSANGWLNRNIATPVKLSNGVSVNHVEVYKRKMGFKRDFRRGEAKTELEKVRALKAELSKSWTGSTEDKTLWGQLCAKEKGLSPVKYGSAINSNREMADYMRQRRLEDAQRRPVFF